MLDSNELEDFTRDRYSSPNTRSPNREGKVSIPPGLETPSQSGRPASPDKQERGKEGFRLFGQNYTVSFQAKSDLYTRFERRLKYKRQKEAQKLANAGKQEPKRV